MWPWPHGPGKDDCPGFAVRTPAAEVAAYIHDVFVPAYRQALARAEIDLRERDEAHARRQVALAKARARGQAVRDELATQLLHAIAPTSRCEERGRGKPVSVSYLPYNDVLRIELTLPVDDAIARAPALARALGAPDDDTAPPPPVACARPTEHRTPAAGNRHPAAGRSNQNDRNGKRRA
ncbi:hypothetical protein SAMN05421854_101433 [Amycolatopsis rubida]|uniref:Uncharacterized protein n=1 Tax=Amycolatopsis rubida TaxID=112413 RepID=A0A1I5E0X5_9PSEU|nr:hypothetical protein SAMN05421854_101433 [Amycolatopsis rubida]